MFIATTVICFIGLLYYKIKYNKSVAHHRHAAATWQKLMLDVAGAHIDNYFNNTVTNKVVYNDKVEISIGGVPVDMGVFYKDGPDVALDNACESCEEKCLVLPKK